MKAYVQRLGRALMLPVACLPTAALFLGIGYWIDPSGWGGNNVIAAFLVTTGAAILDNLGLLFAVGVSIGMAKDKDGAAALSGLVGFLTVTTIMGSAANFLGTAEDELSPAFAAGAIGNKNVFFGIMVGCIAGALYNRFSKTTLPDFLAFFSGRRCVPILTAAVMSVVSVVLLFVWPVVYNGLVTFGESIMGMGAVGAGIYGFFNRILIPTGLHHALNNVFWFNLAGIDDITKFWTGENATPATGGFHPFGVYVTGMYQAGWFPVMMFGLPAGAYAIYRNARPEKKKQVGSLMLAAGLASFLTGVTEPIEFAFMFAAFPLYVVHAFLAAISVFIAASFQWIAGFQFSGGLIDLILSLRVPQAHQPYMLFIQGIVFAGIYFTVFNWAIKRFNLMTPGRELDDAPSDSPSSATGSAEDSSPIARLYTALGGAANVQNIDHCTTRLRLVLKDTNLVDTAAIAALGLPGQKRVSDTDYQVVIGLQVQQWFDDLLAIHEGQPTSGADLHSAGDIGSDSSTSQPGATATIVRPVTLIHPAPGTFRALHDIPDEAFNSGSLGNGFAIVPFLEEFTVMSPVAGTVISVAKTGHGYGIRTEDGAEVLVHIGVDTVKYGDQLFSPRVSKGDTVHAGSPLAEVDYAKAPDGAKFERDVIVLVLKSKDNPNPDFIIE
ncbi:MAG: N-acetylglucosamine-specific PTS transporter subunit IIBC [Corynebacterium sp.]|nr:N-acetylglucosamine-specific PTS transporter subunit IIBC [Corynebacterium sp.]